MGDEITIVLDHTPFYAEAGGQVGDTGYLIASGENVTNALKIEITDTKKNPMGVYLHTGKVLEGEVSVWQPLWATYDNTRRKDTERNHTATHLLQAALRQVLGGHVHQKGSLVNSSGLRFDFTHSQPVSHDELRQVEELVNAQILKNVDVCVTPDVPIDEARKRGAMALFGEKYGNLVRTVEIPDFSLELCGGTHLRNTSEVGLLKITRETGVSSGVRRVEAITGNAVYNYLREQEQKLAQLATLLKSNPNDVLTAAERLVQQKQELEKQNRQLKSGETAQTELAPQDVSGVPVVIHRMDNADGETIANLADKTAQKLGSAVVVIGSVHDGKAAFTAKVTKDLNAKGLHAGNLVREVAKIAGGGGGGRPDFAQAGGRDPGKLQDALDAVPGLVQAQLK